MSYEERADKQFKLHQKELKRYYDQSLKHSTMIFVVGIGTMFIGFVIIGVTAYSVTRIDIESTSLIVGIFANFIAVIYLRMYSSNSESIRDSHNRLVKTHRIHFGHFFASKIAETINREKTYHELAVMVVQENKFPTE